MPSKSWYLNTLLTKRGTLVNHLQAIKRQIWIDSANRFRVRCDNFGKPTSGKDRRPCVRFPGKPFDETVNHRGMSDDCT